MLDNIYHCCLQKTASQWIKDIFSDKIVEETTHMACLNPRRDYITDKSHIDDLKTGWETGKVVSPLYVTYDDFKTIPKKRYKAFLIVRDIRDVIVSQYFSITYSHAIINESHRETRKKLQELPFDESFSLFLKKIYPIGNENFSYKRFFLSWLACDDPNVFKTTYEKLTQQHNVPAWRELFDFLEIEISDAALEALMQRYSFEKISGRNRGDEDKNVHLRKGVAGDWKNYLTAEHKELFKESFGEILIRYGYEEGLDW